MAILEEASVVGSSSSSTTPANPSVSAPSSWEPSTALRCSTTRDASGTRSDPRFIRSGAVILPIKRSRQRAELVDVQQRLLTLKIILATSTEMSAQNQRSDPRRARGTPEPSNPNLSNDRQEASEIHRRPLPVLRVVTKTIRSVPGLRLANYRGNRCPHELPRHNTALYANEGARADDGCRGREWSSLGPRPDGCSDILYRIARWTRRSSSAFPPVTRILGIASADIRHERRYHLAAQHRAAAHPRGLRAVPRPTSGRRRTRFQLTRRPEGGVLRDGLVHAPRAVELPERVRGMENSPSTARSAG